MAASLVRDCFGRFMDVLFFLLIDPWGGFLHIPLWGTGEESTYVLCSFYVDKINLSYVHIISRKYHTHIYIYTSVHTHTYIYIYICLSIYV